MCERVRLSGHGRWVLPDSRGRELDLAGLTYPCRIRSLGENSEVGQAVAVLLGPADFVRDFSRVAQGSEDGDTVMLEPGSDLKK